MRTANYTDLRANLKDYIDSVIDDCDPVVINRGNGKGAVLISLDEYNAMKETEYIIFFSNSFFFSPLGPLSSLSLTHHLYLSL